MLTTPCSSRAAPVRCTLALLLLFVFVVPSMGLAAPPMQDCSQPDSGDRIKCKFSNILDQQQAAVDMLGDMTSIPPSQRDAMKNHAMRAQRAQGRSNAREFKQLTKKSNVECQIAEIIGDGRGDDDGICKGGNEDCVEVLGDGIGDDDGICRRTGRPSEREACAQICDAQSINDNADNFDDDPTQDTLGRDLEEQLDESAAQFEELNGELESQMVQLAAFQANVANGDPCSAVFETRPDDVAEVIASTAAVTLRGIAGQAQPVCQFDVSGFNGAIACVVTETIAAIAEIIDNAIQLLDEEIDSDVLDASYACLQDVNSSVGETNTALAEIMSQIMALQGDVTALRMQVDEVNQLLLEIFHR